MVEVLKRLGLGFLAIAGIVLFAMSPVLAIEFHPIFWIFPVLYGTIIAYSIGTAIRNLL